MKYRVSALAVSVAASSILFIDVGYAQDEKEVGWFNTGELSFVATSGNSSSSTLGFRNLTRRVWEIAEFSVELGTVFSDSRTDDRFGIGALGEGNFTVVDPPRTTVTERLYGGGAYGREIDPHFFWNAAADAERNRPAGIEHRVTVGGGIGNIWVSSDKVTFRTAYNLTYTDENLTAEGSRDFGGFRLQYTYQNNLTSTTVFDSELTFDDNFDEVKDHRSNFFNAVTVTMTEQLALKAGLRLLYRNIPPLEEIKIFDRDPNQGAANELGTALVEKEKLDTNFTTSLVINF